MIKLHLGCVFALFAVSPAFSLAPPNAQTAFDDATVQQLIDTTDSPDGVGSARIAITEGSEDIQVSNFNWNSFIVENTGDKRIAAVFIDVTNAVFGDSVFDSDGRGGDHVSKELTLDTGSEAGPIPIVEYQESWLPVRDSSFDATKPFNSNKMGDVNNLFVDELSETFIESPKAGGGYRGQLLLYTDFDPNETVGFSCDMDPNSLAGLYKDTIDDGANWDVGGVAGSELVGGVVTVLFGDGSSASGTIASDGSQSGGVGVISENLEDAPGLVANGLSAGGAGTYASDTVISVTGSPGNTVRVSIVEGFDPVVSSKRISDIIGAADLIQARLDAQYPEFPASNALEWKHTEVEIPSSGSIDVSHLLIFSDRKNPLALVAVTIDPSNGDPKSFTSEPIHLLCDPCVVSPQPGSPLCFSGQNTVEVQGRGMVAMNNLEIGDRVLTCRGDYSLVYSFFHKHDDLLADYIHITMADGKVLEVTADHLIYSNGTPTRAADVKIGDRIPETVVAVDRHQPRRGLYAPVTLSGDLVVSGACASSYVALWDYNVPWLQNWATHTGMAVIRLTCSTTSGCLDETYDADTGVATRYAYRIAFIAWLEATGGKVGTLIITLLGAPFLALLFMIEQAIWYLSNERGIVCFAATACAVGICSILSRSPNGSAAYCASSSNGSAQKVLTKKTS